MARQEFNTVDVVRLEVETDPTGLVNLVQNPSGELGGWGWITTLSDSAMSRAMLGIRPVLRYDRSVAGASWFTTEALPIAPGQYAAARWLADASSGAPWSRARFEWLDSSGALLSSSAQTSYVGTNSVEPLLAPVVAPASTAYVRLRFDLYSTNSGAAPTGAHWVMFSRVTVAKAATAGELVTVRTNLIHNPSFHVNTTGWATSTAYLATSLAWVASGAVALTADGNALGSGMIVTTPSPVTGGASYVFQVRARAATAGRTVRFIPQWNLDGGGSTPSPNDGVGVVDSTGGWTTYTWVATAPANAVSVQMRIVVVGASAGEVHYFDNVMLEKAEAAEDYFDGATPDTVSWNYAWTGAASNSPSTATATAMQYVAPVEFLNIIGESQHIRVPREQLNAGTLSAVIRSRSLDPSQSTLLRPGRRARLTALVDGVWETLIGGKLLEADVTYEVKDPKVPTEKQARIEVLLVDPTQPLANAGRPEGVATIAELPFVLEGAGVPWNVNGSGNQVPTANVTTYNETAKALDQVALTRDTAIGYAWMSRLGVLNVWDRDQIPSGAPIVLDEDDYSDIDLSFSTKDAINEVQITVQSLGADGTTAETVYGPYTDQASIDEWGRYRKEFTATGLDSAAVDALGAAILAAAATPRIRVNSITIPLHTIARMESRALLDLYDEVRVVLTALGVDDTLRIRGLEHVIETEKWMLRLDFADEGGVAVPTVQPPVQSGIRPDVGVIELFAGATPPAGKLLCNGASYAVADYPHLFAVIGYTFGGAGASFNVPNLTDRFPIGSGTKALGSSGGNPTKVIGTANLPPHAHTINHGHSTNSRPAAGALTSVLAQGGGTATIVANTAVQDFNGNSGNGPGSSTPLDVMNPWLSLNFVIRAA